MKKRGRIFNKKGTHVGAMLSFVIFIVFLIFLYTIIGPTVKTQKGKETMVDYLKKELINNFSVDMIISSVKVKEDYTINGGCFSIEQIIPGVEFIVKDEFEEIIESSPMDTDEEEPLEISISETDSRFFTIYYSNKFETMDGSLSGCDVLSEDDYSLGWTRTKEYAFEPQIRQMILEYGNNYGILKEQLKIPPGTEFGFTFTYEDGTTIQTNEREIVSNVYVEEFPIQYINDEAEISSGFITAKIW